MSYTHKRRIGRPSIPVYRSEQGVVRALGLKLVGCERWDISPAFNFIERHLVKGVLVYIRSIRRGAHFITRGIER